jgi:hypothetical protein
MGCGCGNRAIRRPEVRQATAAKSGTGRPVAERTTSIAGTWNGPKSKPARS